MRGTPVREEQVRGATDSAERILCRCRLKVEKQRRREGALVRDKAVSQVAQFMFGNVVSQD